MGFWQHFVCSLYYGTSDYLMYKQVLSEGISKSILRLDTCIAQFNSSLDTSLLVTPSTNPDVYNLLFISTPDRLERFKSVELKKFVDAKQVDMLEHKLMDSYQLYLSVWSCSKITWN